MADMSLLTRADSIQGLVYGLGDFCGQEIDVYIFFQSLYFGYIIGSNIIFDRIDQIAVSINQPADIIESVLQEMGVISDELHRGVDFVSDSCRQFPDRFQFLRQYYLSLVFFSSRYLLMPTRMYPNASASKLVPLTLKPNIPSLPLG